MKTEIRFKPYKGVSSNDDTMMLSIYLSSFKPYKGVSSNDWFFRNKI